MDCVRTAIRQNATTVTCLYRRDKTNMPGSLQEVTHAEEEGVKFAWLSAPKAFIGDKEISGVRVSQIHLGIPDASGRQTPQAINGTDHSLPADLAIKALGFDPEDLPSFFETPELGVTPWGTIKIDWQSMMTNLDGVFAAGDIVRGASLVVWAIKDGRDAASAIHRFVSSRTKAGRRKFENL